MGSRRIRSCGKPQIDEHTGGLNGILCLFRQGQNKVIRNLFISLEDFSFSFLLERCWPNKAGGYIWIVSAEAHLRRILLEELRGKAYINGKPIRITDYVSAVRCYKCQRFGHTPKYCKNNVMGGHCAGDGHCHRDCPNLHTPRIVDHARPGKENSHNVKNRTYPSFLLAVKKVIIETDYD